MIIFLSYYPCILQANGLIDINNSDSKSRPYFFYHALPYGTQANCNPMNVIINGGYGILQIPDFIGENMGTGYFIESTLKDW
jgi:hypothetical protein